MEYPHIPPHFSKEELFEHFTLTQEERYNLPQWRKEQNILGFAVLLKTFSFLGFPPRKKEDIPAEIVSWISQQLDVDPAGYERYRWMKAKPGKIGIKTLLREIRRLRFVNEFGIKANVHLTGVPDDVLNLLRERAAPEDAYQMKRHQPQHRYALMAVLLHFRRLELTDNIIDIFLNLIRRIHKKADKNLEKDLISSIKAVYKKKELLYKMAKASTENPHDTVENVLFPIVSEEILCRIIEEYEGQDLSYDNTRTVERKKKYTRSYRRMVKPVLDTLVFRTANPVRKSLLAGVDLVRKYLDKKHTYYPEPEDVPIDLLNGVPEEL